MKKKILCAFFALILTVLMVVPASAGASHNFGWETLTTFAERDKTNFQTVSFQASITVSYIANFVYYDDLDENPYILEFADNTWYKSYEFVSKNWLNSSMLINNTQIDGLAYVFTYKFNFLLNVPTTYDVVDGIINNKTQIKLQARQFDALRVEEIVITPVNVPAYYPMKNSDAQYDVYFRTNLFKDEADKLYTLPIGGLVESKYEYCFANFVYNQSGATYHKSSNVNSLHIANRFLTDKCTVTGSEVFSLKRIEIDNKMNVTYTHLGETNTYAYYMSNQVYNSTPRYIYVGIDYNYNDGIAFLPEQGDIGLGVDYSQLYMPIDINYDDSGNIGKDIQNFFAYLFTKTLPNIINNFVVWFMVEAPLINKITAPLYLSAIQTKNIIMQWLVPLLTSVGIFGIIITLVVVLKLIRRILK